jgi:hypothetical protein
MSTEANTQQAEHEGTKARRHEGEEAARTVLADLADRVEDMGMIALALDRLRAMPDEDDRIDRVDDGERGPVPAVLRGDWVSKFNEMLARLDRVEARLEEVESWVNS